MSFVLCLLIHFQPLFQFLRPLFLVGEGIAETEAVSAFRVDVQAGRYSCLQQGGVVKDAV